MGRLKSDLERAHAAYGERSWLEAYEAFASADKLERLPAAEIGERHGDAELMALAIHVQGHMLILSGRVSEGVALLDEAMVIATTADLSPFVVGIVYCGVILACEDGFEVRRAREW